MDTPGIREVTDAEVAHYREHGWVSLPGLVSPELCAELLARAKAIMGADATDHRPREGVDSETNPWQDRHNIIEDDELFASVGMSAQMGRNAQRLMNRQIDVRLYNNALAVKIGMKQPGGVAASEPTPFHQDGTGYPMDRNGVASFWIALDEATPDQGTVRYVSGSHKLASLGRMVSDGKQSVSPFDVYPELNDLVLSEPSGFHPGDAAAHQMFTLHDAGQNETDRPRWAFLVRYVPADTIFTGTPSKSLATQRKVERAGLVAGEPFGGPEYPLVDVDR